jgi:plasmid maintenance system antidote protein VapI
VKWIKTRSEARVKKIMKGVHFFLDFQIQPDKLGTMKLKTYLEFKQKSVRQVAKDLGVTRSWLYEVVNERQPAGRKLALRIVEWSGGAVRLEDLWA